MLHGAFIGDLEVRRAADGATRLVGRFPYGSTAVLSDGGRTGRPRKERIAPRAFSYRIERPEEDIHLLTGHDYNRPLASRKAGTLDVQDSDEAVTFTAIIAQEIANVTHVRDTLALLNGSLAVGISPGFRLPPERAVAKPERIEQEPDDGPGSERRGAIIRTITDALLYELSIVTRPAYEDAAVEARAQRVVTATFHPFARWRP